MTVVKDHSQPVSNGPSPDSQSHTQAPLAVIGMSCRLPGKSNSPSSLWEFLERGGIASNTTPPSRFNLDTHYVGSPKPNTMRSPGGMYLENIDPQEFDAPFFNISREDAIAMDPQQRQLLEVVYEGLENAGITLESLDGAAVACFVASFTCDFGDMLGRDPEDRPPGTLVGLGRAILSNRISHFLNIKGPSVTLDTACSGTLQGIDIASRYLQTREVTTAIVAGANLFLSPEHNMDIGNMKTAHSLTGKCHTFDKKADGYAKAEAVNAVIIKRLDDAIRDGDPIRAVIRGTATTSDGRTPGIASPSSEAQARAIQSAYANAGISDYSITSYLECHGTGTQAGDPIELNGAASVFAATRPKDDPLRIGSIKSNIGHSEPSAGISGLLKTILALEKGIIPGNPTFDHPNPKIDFETLRVRPSKATVPWPDVPYRRASVNSFGFGGSNAHIVVDETASYLGREPDAHCSSYLSGEDNLFAEDDTVSRPVTLVFSANDDKSLKSYVKALSDHLINPNVQIKLPDLAYTLSHRRTRHFHRAYLVTQDPTNIDQGKLVLGKKGLGVPKIGFVFTGQGAQWPRMGKSLLDTFPSTRILLKKLDDVLQSLPEPPSWSLLGELTEPRKPQHLRQPEFSQPIVTALQLVILEILDNWGIKPEAVVGHSSGEIAAACAAGYLTQEQAIKIAFYRGRAVVLDGSKASLGMLAVGLGPEKVQEYIGDLYLLVQIGCFNSPNSVTLSGDSAALETVRERIDKDKHFARLLQVDVAYHSKFMENIAACYKELLLQNCDIAADAHAIDTVTMYSSVIGRQLDYACDAAYWMTNMESPVRFDQAVQAMLSAPAGAPDFLIEIGPSGALAGPISQITALKGSSVQYCAALTRGKDSIEALFAVAGRLFISGGNVDLAKVNADERDLSGRQPRLIVDLPNYVWNHSTKYWHESEASKDWRFRKFPHHDLLGGKVLGTSWELPSFNKTLRMKDQPWLRDHGMGPDIIFPAAGFISMAIEAMYQSHNALKPDTDVSSVDQLSYRLRNVRFDKALVLEEENDAKVTLHLSPHPGPKETWYDFRVVSLNEGSWTEHSSGLIRLEKLSNEVVSKDELAPLKYAKPGSEWYKAFNTIGYGYGPEFQKLLSVEAVVGSLTTRNHISLTEPASILTQSRYPMHPCTLDACIQAFIPSVWRGDRCAPDTVLLPAIIDDLVITNTAKTSDIGIAIATSKYSGRGRKDDKRNWYTDISMYDPETGNMMLKIDALRYHKLPTGTDVGAEHTITRSMWNPDIDFLSAEQLANLAVDKSGSTVQRIIDLIAHKKPALKVLEVDLGSTDTSSIWFAEVNEESRPTRALYSTFNFLTADANSFVAVHEDLSRHRDSTTTLVDVTAVGFTFEESEFDLVILKGDKLNQRLLKSVLQNVRGILSDGGYAILAENSSIITDSGSGSEEDVVVVNSENILNADQIAAIATGNDFYRTATVSCESCTSVNIFVAKPKITVLPKTRELVIANMTDRKPTTEMTTALEVAGWTILESYQPLEDIKPKSTVLIQDELFNPVLKSVSSAQWDSVKYLVSQGCKILWLTQGSQMNVTTPDNALIHGMFRTVRQEDTSLRLMTLDVHKSTGPATIPAVVKVLEIIAGTLPKTFVDNEFVERNGVVFVNRIVPDKLVNQFKDDEGGRGAQPVVKSLHDVQGIANLRAERLGSLDALQYTEAPLTSVEDEHVEIEMIAAGLNSKDITTTQGNTPGNEHLLGMEGAGTVTRVGKAVKTFKVGDRVAVVAQATFANRVQCPVQYVHHIPNSLSFEEAATVPIAYLTSMYCLLNVGNLQKGQSILIHAAAGGVGIACIYLAKYIGAEIYVTVGSDEKRSFLKETFGLHDDRIFSSRTTDFARKIKASMQNKGIDLIINSLTGELLDESWRICADSGTMVEIGNKDILDRQYLSMEPFDRNCSYRSVAIQKLSPSTVTSLLSRCFDLLSGGHIKPINPVTRFGFDRIPEAFAHMRDGRHIGKVVITDGEKGMTTTVPIRPAMHEISLQSNVSYLIVGGLKGICGSLAVYMAAHGAKYIIAMTRSGISDERSQAIVRDCNALGCEVQEAKADVTNTEDVESAFKAATHPVGGIIQGAVILRDKPFESMTLEDYNTAASAKVQGTWNLHRSSLAHKSHMSFFTLLSSMSGIVGQKAQANYSAANVFMDSFASYRHSEGLPAHALDLGIIEEVGFAAREGGIQERMDNRIWLGVNESMVRRMFKYSVLQQTQPINPESATQLIIGIALPQQKGSDLESDARFSALFSNHNSGDQHAGSKAGDEDAKAVQTFLLLHRNQADKSSLVAAGLEVLSMQFTKTLRLTEAMEPAKSLSAYGVDSLSAVEVRNWVRVQLGVELTTLDITNASSLFGLCEKMIAKMPAVGE
ncbi:Fumagillin dodecapentaenoate synthase [Lachnellula hyalina]|uniref:Fumagillin dodecapentaenoate synthase n=1 Tax=Lachnellula hyalina TaxID=1316788 RepID=A0A8H8R2N0_9HELO|nr:Fumagillin dodecapentaenoate synthase [Lachnellula hyalina]TVY26941.1 Fumagillin dodecapentaenoate synthase [Lachnellula hyalina]